MIYISSTIIQSVIEKYKYICEISNQNTYFWHPNDYLYNIYHLQNNDLIEFKRDLNICFQFFLHISTSDYKKKRIQLNFPSFYNALSSTDNWTKQITLKFIFILQLFSFFTSQKFSKNITLLVFVLRFRGLSVNGNSFLHKFGICQSSKNFKSRFSSIRETILLNSNNNYSDGTFCYWFDNLTKKRHGKRLDYNNSSHVKLTIEAKTQMSPFKVPFCSEKYLYKFIIKNYLFETLLEEVDAVIKYNAIDCDINSILVDHLTITNPIMIETNSHYKFMPQAVHSYECGTLDGTLSILFSLSNELCEDSSENNYIFLSVDYDIYWRISKVLFSKTFTGLFKQLRTKLVLILAPWHIYYKLSSGVWKLFNNFFTSFVWLENYKGSALEDPPLNKQLPFWIAIWKYKKVLLLRIKHISTLNSNIKFLLKVLIKSLVPLVFFLIIFTYSIMKSI